MSDDRADRIAALTRAADERILLLDGAMGTMVQAEGLNEDEFRASRFAGHPTALKGNNDILVLTKPDVVRGIHEAYLAAGSDILLTNTFNSTSIAQADYDMEAEVAALNAAAARIAREACAAAEKKDGRMRWVAGVLGPTNRTASISPDVNDPGFRNVTFDGLTEAYAEATRALIEGGADLILIETIFDTLNAKAAIHAVQEVFEAMDVELPIMISGTITDLSGRTLSGQTVEAFWISVQHARPFSVGLNCALGSKELRRFVREMSRVAQTRVSAHPNAGLPNAFGGYDEQPETTAAAMRDWAENGLVNIVGGCCGTTPDHIAAMRAAIDGLAPRLVPSFDPRLRLSGLEPFEMAR